MKFVEYIWIDGMKPTPKLRAKTKTIISEDVPCWTFDGSSTNQASHKISDCILRPVCVIGDPLRGRPHKLALCEVYNYDNSPVETNYRYYMNELYQRNKKYEPFFGIEQEYTMFKGHIPLGWPQGGFPAQQGPFYCGVGADEVFGREIVEEHMMACRDASLLIAGANAEVMPGQWEFQIGPENPLVVSDHIWLARYLLYRIAEKHGVTIRLDPKPVKGNWNGAGAHVNFSTVEMRSADKKCKEAADLLGVDFAKYGFPKIYGAGYKERLTGLHETCKWDEFRWGVGDRNVSVRIPKHVEKNGCGYIEDRRPCSNADPYQICQYIMGVCCA